MNIALISLHDQKFQPLGDLTWTQNKEVYADMHDYMAFCRTDDFHGNVSIGFEKIWLLKQMMELNPEVDWFWWTGCDTMITNFTTKVEDKIDNAYDIIIASDCNGINSDSFLLKNSAKGKEWIDRIWASEPIYKSHHWFEQQSMIDLIESDFKECTKIVPQRYLNAYNTAIYSNQPSTDLFGNDGTWHVGDWLIHWPGLSLPHRLQLASYYATQVVK